MDNVRCEHHIKRLVDGCKKPGCSHKPDKLQYTNTSINMLPPYSNFTNILNICTQRNIQFSHIHIGAGRYIMETKVNNYELCIAELSGMLAQARVRYQQAVKQVHILDNVIAQLRVRYMKANRDQHKSFRCSLRCRIVCHDGVRNMIYEYAWRKCEEIAYLQRLERKVTRMAEHHAASEIYNQHMQAVNAKRQDDNSS